MFRSKIIVDRAEGREHRPRTAGWPVASFLLRDVMHLKPVFVGMGVGVGWKGRNGSASAMCVDALASVEGELLRSSLTPFGLPICVHPSSHTRMIRFL